MARAKGRNGRCCKQCWHLLQSMPPPLHGAGGPGWALHHLNQAMTLHKAHCFPSSSMPWVQMSCSIQAGGMLWKWHKGFGEAECFCVPLYTKPRVCTVGSQSVLQHKNGIFHETALALLIWLGLYQRLFKYNFPG